MSGVGRIAGALRRDGRAAGIAPYVLTVGAVVLGWQIAIQPLKLRAPVEAAVRIAPGSPTVLGRAAESEFAAGRSANAAFLAREALRRAPFDVRALRVVGLSEAKAGRTAQADEMLTLAGNWSLRDDPSHAWLVEYRLRRGDYGSAFAHADTLVRRREDIQPQVFNLFTTAAVADPQRALPAIARLMAANPPWRRDYIYSLDDNLQGLGVGASLAMLLQQTSSPLTNTELQQFYGGLADRNQIDAVKTLRARLNRPAANAAVVNGTFDGPPAPEPFQWILMQKGGAFADIAPDEAGKEGPALRVEYDGYSTAVIVRQRIFLNPGRYRFGVVSRTESGNPTDRLAWTVSCAPGGEMLLTLPVAAVAKTGPVVWEPASAEFSTPANCPSQWLELRGVPLDYRAPMVSWFDRVSIRPLSTPPA